MLTVCSVPYVHQLQMSLVSTLAYSPAHFRVSFLKTSWIGWIGEQNYRLLQRLIGFWPSSETGPQSTLLVCNGASLRCRARRDDAAAGPYMKRKPQTEKEKMQTFDPFVASVESTPLSTSFTKQNLENQRSSKQTGSIDTRKQIFCNRSLNMRSIVAVGFDMDYTLAQYKPDTFETLAYHGTIKKLVFDLGYSQELLQWKFDWRYMVRGLVLDKRRGNILKMDRHKYVKVAYHGFREMSRDDRMATYGNTLSRESFDEPDYALIDTLFSLAEAYLFAQLVEFKDAHPNNVRCSIDYAQMYRDVRAAVDLCHRDGTLKQAVAKDPGKYVHYDPQLIPMLQMLRDSGRKTFLVTNSLWDYSRVVMNHLFGKCETDCGSHHDEGWLKYFDLIITGSAKPGFFADGNRASLYEVDIRTGMLQNTDNGTPLTQIGGIGLSKPASSEKASKQGCKVFQGGNVAHLNRLLSIEAGAQVLYVGDHIYGDILRSKKQLGWRTMLVVPELEKELELFYKTVNIRKEFRLLRQQRDSLEDKIHQLDWALKFEKFSNEERNRIQSDMEALQVQRDKVRELHRQAQRVCHQRYHKVWGQLMKTGYQNSRFAHQVERFACLYTSQVTNLCYYSPDKSYRTSEDFMPHEFDSLGL